jgi:hypothetical protein
VRVFIWILTAVLVLGLIWVGRERKTECRDRLAQMMGVCEPPPN